MKPIHFLLFFLLITGYFAYKIFDPFLETITIAVLLALATYKINDFFVKKLKNKIAAAFLSSVVISILFFAPIVYLITNAATTIANIDTNYIKEIYANVYNWIVSFVSKSEFFKNINILELIEKIDINSIAQNLITIASFLATKSAKFLKDIVLILIFFFFSNLYGKEILLYFQKIAPFPKDESLKLFENLANVMSVVFSSIVATTFLQGILFGIVAQIYGYNGLMFGILYGFSSLIPVVGGILIWLPLVIHKIAIGDTNSAIAIALYSIVVISIVADTFIKPMIIKYINTIIIKKEFYINELLIFFSIVAGISTYGFWGMILGPAIITLLISILNIFPQVNKT